MARSPLLAICPRSPRPPLLLRWLQHQFLHLPLPWLQAGRNFNGTPQQAPWRGRGPGQKRFYPFSRAQRPTYLHMLRREEDKGKAGQVQSHKSHRYHTTSIGHGTEGWLTDTWPLEEWDWQCSRHARRKHRCQVPFGEYTRKVSAGGGAGEEEDVLRFMPLTTPTRLYLRWPRLRADGCGCDIHPEKYIHSPQNKVAAILLLDLRISQE